MNWYYTICIKNVRIRVYEFVQMNSYYTICIKNVRIRIYEFVQKLAEKKRNQVGISTQDQNGLQSLQRDLSYEIKGVDYKLAE